MASKRKQHILSKTYLKHFSVNGDGKNIYVINSQDRYRQGVQRKDSGDSIFWEPNFYNSEKYATPTLLEDFFAEQIEPLYNDIILTIKEEPPLTDIQSF